MEQKVQPVFNSRELDYFGDQITYFIKVQVIRVLIPREYNFQRPIIGSNMFHLVGRLGCVSKYFFKYVQTYKRTVLCDMHMSQSDTLSQSM